MIDVMGLINMYIHQSHTTLKRCVLTLTTFGSKHSACLQIVKNFYDTGI